MKDVNTSDPTNDNYCQLTVFLFGYWSATGFYILIGIVLVAGCVYASIAKCWQCLSSDVNESQDSETAND